jgi:hypothetical protein
MTVKNNHPLLRKKIAGFFNSPTLYEAEFHRATETARGRGRVETRTLVSPAMICRAVSPVSRAFVNCCVWSAPSYTRSQASFVRKRFLA